VVDQVHPLEARSKEGAIKVATLLYHDVVEDGRFDDSGFPGVVPSRYKLRAEDFRMHLEALDESTSEPPSVAHELPARNNGLPWLLTFDDGGSSALPIGRLLTERGWRGHFFVTVDYIGTPGFLLPDEIRSLSELGHVIGSHSCSHPERMAQCPWDELVDEWTRSTDVLSELLGRRVAVASVPAGNYGKIVARAAAVAGIRTLFTSEPVTNVREVDGCSVVGRFTILRGAQPETAAALARARLRPRLSQFASWNAKKAAKTIGGEYYLRVRRRLLGGAR
jgi:peptidoglycan/xylan/chitin deacetylase (PgdA/CDA1 family)